MPQNNLIDIIRNLPGRRRMNLQTATDWTPIDATTLKKKQWKAPNSPKCIMRRVTSLLTLFLPKEYQNHSMISKVHLWCSWHQSTFISRKYLLHGYISRHWSWSDGHHMQHTKMDRWEGWKSDIDVGKRFQIMGVLFPNYILYTFTIYL